MIAQEALFELSVEKSELSQAKVVHCKKEPCDVYIGRPAHGLKGSIWANPFKIGKDGTREEVIEKYRHYVLSKPELLQQLESLRGKTLGCWCSPQKCHGDVLVELLSAGSIPPTSTPIALGPCCKKGCPESATRKSPSGNVYCENCGHCKRNVYGTMKGVIVLREQCRRSVEQFVWHERLSIYVCPCLLKFEQELERRSR